MHFNFSKFALYVCYDLLLNSSLLEQLYTPFPRAQLLYQDQLIQLKIPFLVQHLQG